MPAEIRPATLSDIDALAALEEAVFAADRISPRSFRRLVGGGQAIVLVAAQGRDIHGYALVLLRRGSGLARLYSLAARAEGAGLGRLLLERAEQAATRSGRQVMRLEVREDNARAVALYEKNGYRPIGRKPGYYEDGAAALRYEKPLSGAGERSRP